MTEHEFKRIYNQLFSRIYRIALKITGNIHRAEDICHDAFLKLFEKDPVLKDDIQTAYWLIRVVKNLSYNTEKRRTVERKAYKKLENIVPDAQSSSEDEFIKIETELSVQKALNSLPSKLRLALVLKEFEGLTYKEIGSIIGTSEANVKVRIFRGRAKLEKILKEMDHVP